MPTYDYHCSKCDYSFEEFHTMSITLKKCPQCQQETLERGCGGGFAIRIKRDQSFYKQQERKEQKAHRKQTTEKFRKKYQNKKPWWRGEKIDMGVLKNPEKYIKTGET
jgi:putative FmdB family regulatory protein